jgi:hypothetical protein
VPDAGTGVADGAGQRTRLSTMRAMVWLFAPTRCYDLVHSCYTQLLPEADGNISLVWKAFTLKLKRR